jgi:DNA mismatch repair protein MutL
MSRIDAEFAIINNATSKVICVEDIQFVSTFGIKEETIPSITSVSRFLLLTNEVD